MTLTIARAGKDGPADVTLEHRLQRSFKIIPVADPDAGQSAILADLMKARQLPHRKSSS